MSSVIFLAIIAFLFVIAVTLYIRLQALYTQLSQKASLCIEEEIIQNGIMVPLVYKQGENIVCNKAFEHAFGSFGKECIKLISNLPKSGEHSQEVMFDNAITKRVLIYTTPLLYTGSLPNDFLALIIDVHSLHNCKNALLLQKERFELALESSDEALWDWDMKSDVVFYSPKWKSIMGYSANETPSSLNSWLNLVHSKDMALVNERLKAHLDGKTDFFIVEHRIRQSEPLQWVKVKGKVTRGKSDQAIRMVGTLRDISQQKNQEMTLNEEHARFIAFFEFLPALAFIKNAQGHYLYMNQAYQKFLGFKTWKNKTAMDLFDAKTAHALAETDRLSLYEGIHEHALDLPTQEGMLEHFTLYKFLIDSGDEKLICGYNINKSFKV